MYSIDIYFFFCRRFMLVKFTNIPVREEFVKYCMKVEWCVSSFPFFFFKSLNET